MGRYKDYKDNNVLDKLREVHIEIIKEIDRICKKHNITYFMYGGTMLGAVRHKDYIPWDDDVDFAMMRKDYDKFIEVCKSELDSKYYMDCSELEPKSYYGFLKIRKANTLFDEIGSRGIVPRRGIFVDVFPLDNVDDINSKREYFKSVLVKNLKEVMYYKYGMLDCVRNKSFLIFKIFSPETLTRWYVKLSKSNKNDNSKYVFFHFGKPFKSECMLRDKILPTTEYEFHGMMLPGVNDSDYYLSRIYGNYMKLPPVEDRENHMPEVILFDKESIDE